MKNIILLLSLTFFTNPLLAQNKTPDYWKCSNKSGGSWTFGRAPNACDVVSFIKPEYVSDEYAPLIFDDNKNIEEERTRYMSELYPVIREISEYFLKNRKPEVDEEEISEFSKAAFAIAYQESYWSQYRTPVGKGIQMMRGDYGHGHGIFQVDDRWHFAAINGNVGANFVLNIMYSLEEYYAAWKRAPAQSCVKSERDWVARARSAYSAYNGGPSKICRWTNSKDTWARNDQGFKAKYDGLAWEKYVDDTTKEGYLNIECANNEGVNCNKGEVHTSPKEGILYSHESNGTCVYKSSEEKFYCTNSNEVCLVSKVYTQSFSSVKNARLDDDFKEFEFEMIDSDSVCSNIVGLYSKLSSLELKKNINVRATAGGDLLGVLKAGQTTQILGQVISNAVTQDRYYKVVFGQKVGYIFAGNKSDYSAWSVTTTKALTNKALAQVGNFVKASDNLRSIDGSDVINEGDTFKVSKVSFKENSVYFDLDINGGDTSFYAGDLNVVNFNDFFSVIVKKEDSTPPIQDNTPKIKKGRLSSSIWWKSIKSCAAASCSSAGTIKGPKLSSKSFLIIDEKNGWYKINQNGKIGWIEMRYVKVL